MPASANSLRENIFDGASDVPSLSYVTVAFPPIVLLVLLAVFGLLVATSATHSRARYRQRLEDAYSRFEQGGPAHDTEAPA
jgi:hypothetical protein